MNRIDKTYLPKVGDVLYVKRNYRTSQGPGFWEVYWLIKETKNTRFNIKPLTDLPGSVTGWSVSELTRDFDDYGKTEVYLVNNSAAKILFGEQ